ncbi:hypothetical protein PMZ80_003654 [Knufia obscura]|uniref:F-box domain-containing protein n=2 Tax=Knufia TaxID=430999 RepID=A0AAN8ETC0_9EURO|nr:hypothetical protein PMZ80_003654 [Knufia obscura]KAK5958433.1 hypothetical protein OHC33_000276 [Knufia fluminis]
MPHITSLPDEILLTIAGYIYADDLYDHSMPSLAATSQRFFDITFEVYWLHRVKHFATKSAGDELVEPTLPREMMMVAKASTDQDNKKD